MAQRCLLQGACVCRLQSTSYSTGKTITLESLSCGAGPCQAAIGVYAFQGGLPTAGVSGISGLTGGVTGLTGTYAPLNLCDDLIFYSNGTIDYDVSSGSVIVHSEARNILCGTSGPTAAPSARNENFLQYSNASGALSIWDGRCGATGWKGIVGTGQISSGANVGGQTGTVFQSQVGSTLNFKTIGSTGGSIIVSNGANSIDLSVNQSMFVTGATNLGTNGQIFSSKVGSTLQFKDITVDSTLLINNSSNILLGINPNADGGPVTVTYTTVAGSIAVQQNGTISLRQSGTLVMMHMTDLRVTSLAGGYTNVIVFGFNIPVAYRPSISPNHAFLQRILLQDTANAYVGDATIFIDPNTGNVVIGMPPATSFGAISGQAGIINQVVYWMIGT